MTLKHDDFPSSGAFDAISDALKANEQDRKKAIQDSQVIYALKLKNKAGTEQAWYIDMKETGTVGRGLAPEGKKPGVTLSLTDENFQKLIEGKSKPQTLFMSGKLKVSGNMMKATSLAPLLSKVGEKPKL